MIQFFQNLFYALKLIRYGRYNQFVLRTMACISEVMNKSIETGEPITTKIMMDFQGTETIDFLSFWAHVGDKCPFDRIVELREENEKLKAQLKNQP